MFLNETYLLSPIQCHHLHLEDCCLEWEITAITNYESHVEKVHDVKTRKYGIREYLCIVHILCAHRYGIRKYLYIIHMISTQRYGIREYEHTIYTLLQLHIVYNIHMFFILIYIYVYTCIYVCIIYDITYSQL